jgi:23S rRNA pseudouridine1911/1915/1917 synthase
LVERFFDVKEVHRFEPCTAHMDIKIIYEDNDILVIDKPAGLIVFPEGQSLESKEKTLIDYLIEKHPKLADTGCPPRYGIVHRLDKDTSGVLLISKNPETLIFLQNQFINREVEKKYVCLVEGVIKEDKKTIHTLIGRAKGDKRKQRVYSIGQVKLEGKREAITEYKVLEKFSNYTLLNVQIRTGRRHQIRCHLSFIHHPIAGDKLYGFKNSPIPEGLIRQFLHASYLKIQLPNGKIQEFKSNLPEELNNILKNLKKDYE